MKRWGVAAALAGLVLTGVAVGSVGDGAHASLSERCRFFADAAEERRAAVAGSGVRVGVIGDSYAQGLKLRDPETSWPSRLDGRVVVDGFSGSGFSESASPCAGQAYHRRVERLLDSDPELVVVQGGLNDFDVPSGEVRAGVRRLLAELEGRRVVVVGPPAAPRRESGAERVDRILAEVTSELAVPYVRTSRWRLEYLADRLHLTAAGHRVFGDRVAAAVAAIGSPST